jgi:hypothetical protein
MISASELVENLLEEFGEDPQELKDFASGAGEKGVPLAGLPNDFEYRRLAGRLEGARGGSKKIERNTWLIKHSDGTITLRFHETDVITWHPDNTVVFDTNEYMSKTTLARMYDFLPIGGWTIYSKMGRGDNAQFGPSYSFNAQGKTYDASVRVGEWFWHNRSMDAQRQNAKYHRIQPYTDGDKIDSGGTLYPQAPPIFKKRGKFLKPPPQEPAAPAPEQPDIGLPNAPGL